MRDLTALRWKDVGWAGSAITVSRAMSAGIEGPTISCHDQLADQLLLPRGCLNRVVDELEAHWVTSKVNDERSDGDEISVAFNGALSGDQQAAVTALAKHDIGVLVHRRARVRQSSPQR